MSSSVDDIEFDDDVLRIMNMVDDYSENIKMDKEEENGKGKTIFKQPDKNKQKIKMGSWINSEKQFKKKKQVFQTKEKHRPDLISGQKQNINDNKNNKSSFLRKPVNQGEFKQKLKIQSYSEPVEDESPNHITYNSRQSMEKGNDLSHYKNSRKENKHNQSMNRRSDYSTDGELENKHKYNKRINEKVDYRFQNDSDGDTGYKQRRQLRNDFSPQRNYTRKKTNDQRVNRRFNFQNGLKDHRKYPHRTRTYSDPGNGLEKINTYNKRENKKYDYRFKREFDDHSENNQISKLDSDSGPTIEYTNKIPFGQSINKKTNNSFKKEFENQSKYKQIQRKCFSSEDEFETKNSFNKRINKNDYHGFQKEFEDSNIHKQKSKIRNVYNPKSKYKTDQTYNQIIKNNIDNNSGNGYDVKTDYSKRLLRDFSTKTESLNKNSYKKMFNQKDDFNFKREFYDKRGNDQRTKVNRDSNPIIKYRNENNQRRFMKKDQNVQSNFVDENGYRQSIRRYSSSEDESENQKTYNKRTNKNIDYSSRREFEDHSRKSERTKINRKSSPNSKKNDTNTYDRRIKKMADYSFQTESEDQGDYKQRINRREFYKSTSESESEIESNPKINMSSNRAHHKFESETGLSLVPRNEWGAPKPKWGCGPSMKIPVPNVFILTTDKRSCFNKDDCSKEMLFLAKRHMNTQLCPDIKYNFVIGGDGRVYEGRGWITRPGLPTEHNSLNKLSLLIGLAGKYDEEYFPSEMRDARDKLIDYGVHHKYIQNDYVLHSPVD